MLRAASRVFFSFPQYGMMFSTGSGEYKGPKAPKKWVEMKKAKKRARKLLERKDRGSRPLALPPEINAKNLSSAMGVRTLDILKLMIRLGERPWSAEQPMKKDVVELICEELYFEPVWEKTTSDVDVLPVGKPKDLSGFPRRPLVVTIMGHVDHGKTTLLDKIRGTDVASGEAGGITQHVSIFQTKLKNSGEMMTFMDTPGHAAFARIRERGTNITDIACLVVAADDGVQDQTREAIDYIKKKNVPYFVVVTKIDKNGADAEAVYMQLLKEEVPLEKYGGTVASVEVSAKTGKGMDVLEDTILMQQELLDPRADVSPTQSEAVVIESEVNRYTGATCTVLVQWGKLRVGDSFVAGTSFGRIKSLATPSGRPLKEALPSFPVILGGCKSSDPPNPGDMLITVEDEKLARKIAENRAFVADKGLMNAEEDKYEEEEEDEDNEEDGQDGDDEQEGAPAGKKSLNVILKADVEGSVQALKGSLEGLPQDAVKMRFVRAGLGELSVADIELAKDSDAVLICFNVGVPAKAKKLAESLEVQIVESNIIYSILDHAKERIEELVDPVRVMHVVGEAEVLQCFPLRRGSSQVVVGGSRVRSGTIKSSDAVRVVRQGQTLFEGPIEELRKEKAVVKEVKTNMECGILVEGFDGFKPGDIIQSLQSKMEKKKLFDEKT